MHYRSDEYADYPFVHIKEISDRVTPELVPILSQVQIDLETFLSGCLDFVGAKIIRNLARKLDSLFFNEIYEKNEKSFKLNSLAFGQFKNDLQNNLFPLFGTINPNPAKLFDKLNSLFQSDPIITTPEPEIDFC